jgi:hypothetical protein
MRKRHPKYEWFSKQVTGAMPNTLALPRNRRLLTL